jgi:hypothetical protein
MSILEQAREKLRKLCVEKSLNERAERVSVRPLTPEEAIGSYVSKAPLPITTGVEKVVGADFLGSKGHAFTTSPEPFTGTLWEVFQLPLDAAVNRAIFACTLNAVVRFCGLASDTVHCKDDGPEKCAKAMLGWITAKHGKVKVGVVGFQPAIVQTLTASLSSKMVRVTDLNPSLIGMVLGGVEIWDAKAATDKVASWCDVGLITGSSITNGTIDGLIATFEGCQKPYYFYGVSHSGVAALLGLPRLCFRGR